MQSASCPTLPCQRKSSSICYDFVKNQCSRGDACRYSHDIASILYNKRPGPSTGKNPHVMCLDFSRGRCMRGDSCKYVHAPIYEPIRQILPPPSPPPSFYNSGEHQVTGDPVPFQEQSAEHYAALLRMLESVRVEQASAASPCPASPFPLAHHPPRNDLQEPGSVTSNYGVPTCRSLDALAVPFYHNHGGGGDGLPLPLPKTSTASVKLSPHLLYGSPHHGLDSPTIPASWGGNTESTPMQTQKENHGNPYGGMMQGGMPHQPDLPTAAAGCAINNGGRGGDQMIKLETLKSIWSQK